MPIQSTDLYTRQCQECGKRQETKPCAEYRGDSWRDKKCRYCHSEALDYGGFGWNRHVDGSFSHLCSPDDSEES